MAPVSVSRSSTSSIKHEVNMNSNAQSLAALVGRILLSTLFLWSGVGKIIHYDSTGGYMASGGLPMVAVLLPLTILVEVGGAVLLILGLKARLAAAALCAFDLLAAFVFHSFWAVPPDQALMQMINFMKNVSISGGMLMVVAAGPGRYSVDGA